MNKTEFCAEMASRTGLSKSECQREYDAVMGCLYDFVAEGNDVNVFGIGQFIVKDEAEHEARNPLTGEAITVPARKAVKFKMSKSLKDAVKKLPV